MTPATTHSSPPPNWVESNHPLGWLIIRTAEGRGIASRQRQERLQRAAEPLLAATTNPAAAVVTTKGSGRSPRRRRYGLFGGHRQNHDLRAESYSPAYEISVSESP
jgi:hypothetical protein